MKSLRFLDRRAGFTLASLGMLLGIVAPAALPAFASADVITSRSITMSSSATGASDTIEVKGTLSATGALPASGGFVVLFCSDSPLIGASCTAPTGMLVTSPSGAGSSTAGTATKISDNAIKFTLTGTLANSASFDFTVSGLTNPSSAGTFYARLATYNDTNLALASDDTHAGLIDSGSVALSATDNVGVTASVLESLTFCVFGDPNNNTASANGTANASGYLATQTTSTNGPGTNCNDNTSGHLNGSPSPSVQLGQVSSNVSALSTSAVSYAAGWAQLSTNASSGAVVYLKTSNSCVGLHRTSASAGTCDIPSAGATANGTLAAGTAGFGLSFGSAVTASANASGSIENNLNYTNSNGHYAMLGSGASTSSGQTSSALNGLVQDTTSTYGGFVFGSAGAPVADQDIPFSFGATIGNNTPAGSYTANLNLIAVGTY